MIEMFGVVGGVEALKWGELGLEGRGGEGGRYSCMLKIAHNVKDSKLAAILNNRRDVPNLLSRPLWYAYRDTT